LHTHRREIWAFGVGFVLLAGAGVLQAFHHVRGQFDIYPHRLFTLPGALLQGEPAVGAEGLYFTRMPGRSPSFEAWRWSGNQLVPLPPAEDEFHPTTAPALADVWVELAGPVSNIVRFPSRTSAGVSTSQIEVVNGEQPGVSPDGKWLVFVREHQGRGELWIKELAPWPASLRGEVRKVVDDSRDVWEAAFEPGDRHIVFTAAPKAQPELYSLDMANGRAAPMPIAGPARYPAFSPDGQWLAYSRCEQGTWHVYVTNLTSSSSRKLTQGDCNSISPAWEPDSKSLIYATDCGRGLEMTALARIEVSP
jgi:tricorn protease-like protein